MPKGDKNSVLNKARAIVKQKQQEFNYTVSKTGCWIWKGGVGKDGYGKLKRNGKTIRAHRFFFELHKHLILPGQVVCHTCDTPLCVNPEHLFAGTQLDNERDKDAKGRRPDSPSITHPESLPRGEDHHRYGKGMPGHVAQALLEANVGRPLSNQHKERLSPLTPEQVVAIRNDTRPQHEIAADYGVAQITISRIKRKVRWTHV